MLRVSDCFLGRWGHRDFLRGRTKRGGAIHTRHTHGSRGRYKRLSVIFGLRDGRRHVGNHMKGGLGIKLGGGLFGLRIPRQHALSTMSREEFEVAVNGHPNITNPYRQRMEEHPDLRGVMRNARLGVHIVVLMPRVARVAPEGRIAGSLPQAWEKLFQHLAGIVQAECRALTDDGGEVTVHCATTSASVCCDCLTNEAMRGAGVSLYEDLMRGAKVGSSSCRRCGTLGLRLFGAPLLNSATAFISSGNTASFLPYSLPLTTGQCRKRCAFSHDAGSAVNGDNKSLSKSSSAVPVTTVTQRGAQSLLREMRLLCPDALNICLRLEGSLSASDVMTKISERTATSTRESPRKLLVADIDPDEVGVWSQPAATVDALMRWKYFNWDPRAHNKDGLPHHKRWQRVHIFVDASKVREGMQTSSLTKLGSSRQQTAARSLMSSQFSESLKEMNFKRVSSNSLAETLMALRGWSVDGQWCALEHL